MPERIPVATPPVEALDLGACAREPIHIPGSIQSHGLLLVVDPATDVIEQSAGDPAWLRAIGGSALGRTAREVIGFSLASLVEKAETGLGSEPIYLGVVGPFGDRGELTIIAHEVQGSAIIEGTPTAWPPSAAVTLANIRSITERIGAASGLHEACEFAAREVRRITGYDRVMVYQFLLDGSGSVIAEVKDGALPTLLNHRYPASDIPRQARDLYRRSAIRVIPDVAYVPEPITPPLSLKTNQPLDMSHCALRGISPIHIQYLKNMNVGASMSVSLLPRGELWGLIACHNTTAKLVPYEAQEACRHVGQILSQQIRAWEEADGHSLAIELSAARTNILRALERAEDPDKTLLASCAGLQGIVPSHGIALLRKQDLATAGGVPTEGQIRRIADWLGHHMSGAGFFASHRLGEVYPEAAAFASVGAGLLAILLPGDDPVLLMWFRAEQIEEVAWAGNPHEAELPGSSPGPLNPRKSFASWRETVRGSARAWLPVEMESAQGFSLRLAFVLQMRKVHELNRLLGEANERLAALAATDGLTGVANRRAFDDRLPLEWTRADRARRPLALITVDLDFFKQYNDQFGHPMGDACLKRVAHTLQHGRRAADLVARVGGEEFALLLPDTDIEGAIAVAEAARAQIEALHIDHPKSPLAIVTASFGVAVATPRRNDKAADLAQAADDALYRAKASGRNRVARFDVA